MELALDFEAATSVPLKPPGVAGKRTLKQKGALLKEAAKRTAELRCGRVSSGERQEKCKALMGLKWPETGGHDHACGGQNAAAWGGRMGSEGI